MNKIIEVNGLKRHFRVLQYQEGLLGVFKDLFSGNDKTIKAVASSGYSDDPVMAGPENDDFVAKLVKPRLRDDFRRVVAPLLPP